MKLWCLTSKRWLECLGPEILIAPLSFWNFLWQCINYLLKIQMSSSSELGISPDSGIWESAYATRFKNHSLKSWGQHHASLPFPLSPLTCSVPPTRLLGLSGPGPGVDCCRPRLKFSMAMYHLHVYAWWLVPFHHDPLGKQELSLDTI